MIAGGNRTKRPLTALVAQRLIALPFLVLGAWCLLFPGTVKRLAFRPEYYQNSIATSLMIGCFGAQAVLSGLFAAFSRFTRPTFLAYGIALRPSSGSITGSCSWCRSSPNGWRSTLLPMWPC